MSLRQYFTSNTRQYALITANYWAFTLTDGALRMLVVLFFHQLGYAPLEIALLFMFYEFFGVITNLLGGWLGARLGLNQTMNIGLALQIIALAMLAAPADWLTIVWVMAAQALSGIAKDLNKMSAKSAVKLLVTNRLTADNSTPDNSTPNKKEDTLYRWVATLTGSKNTLKGIGFFLGAALLMSIGFQYAVILMAAALVLMWLVSVALLQSKLGKASRKPKFANLFSKSSDINRLSLARLFLFGARDVWFVIAVPVFLSQQLQWSHLYVGGFMALWVMFYGAVQTLAPIITTHLHTPTGRSVSIWAAVLSIIPATLAILSITQIQIEIFIIGLFFFGFIFAINSSLHSFLIVNYANADAISMDVGFYYMANAAGRLLGTVLSGWVFQTWGLNACLWVSASFIALAALISNRLPNR